MEGENVIICFIFLLSGTQSCFSLKWSDCGPEDAKMRFEKFDLDPLPLLFGKKANCAAKVHIMDPIHNGFSDLKISRVFNAFGFEVPISLPCIDGYGACLSDLEFTLKDSDMICGLLRASNRTCDIPLEKGVMETESYQFDVPQLNGIFSLFASGLYRVKWNWLNSSKNVIGCITADIAFS